MGDQELEVRYIHLKDLLVEFIKRRPMSVLELVLKDEVGVKVKHRSGEFVDSEGHPVHWWDLNTYVRVHSCATLTIQQVGVLFNTSVAQIKIDFRPNEFRDYSSVELEDPNPCVTLNFVCGRSKSLADVARFFGSQARTDLTSKVLRFLKVPQPTALPPPTSVRGYKVHYPAIHWLNDDILLGIFDYYRLYVKTGWNDRLGWCKLSHVCQRWRHLIYECAFHLGMHIQCTEGTPTVDMLDHLPPLPLFVVSRHAMSPVTMLTEQDESWLGIYHALRLHDRVRHIDLFLPPSITHKVFVLLDEQFPILEHLSLKFSSTSKTNLPLTLPKGFLAPNLRYLELPSISPPRRLRFLTSTVSLVRLELSNIQTSSYFRPRLLASRLRSLPQLKELSIGFSTPIPRPSTERDLLGEQETLVTLPNLTYLQFTGVGAYLESLVAQIRVPLLEHLRITLFNQIAFVLPHLFHLIDITEGFKPPRTTVDFEYNEVSITAYSNSFSIFEKVFGLCVLCKPLDWQIDCAAQICAFIPALSGVEYLRLRSSRGIPTELRNGAIDSAMWHDLLRSFIGVKELYIGYELVEELSRALQEDEVGSDPGFLPNLGSIHATDNLFTSFIGTRKVVGRPVEFVKP